MYKLLLGSMNLNLGLNLKGKIKCKRRNVLTLKNIYT